MSDTIETFPHSPGPSPVERGYSGWLLDVGQALAGLALEPCRRPYSAAFAAAVRMRLQDPHYGQLLKMMHQSQPEMTGEEAMRIIRTSTQAALIDDEEFNYPSPRYTEPDAWYQAHYLMDNPREDPP